MSRLFFTTKIKFKANVTRPVKQVVEANKIAIAILKRSSKLV